MSLRIIYGRAGSGKSRFCIEDIKRNKTKYPDKTLILMVPEQFTLEAERNLVKALGASGIGEAEVMSFKGLARRVLDEVGGAAKTHVNSAGKAMIIYSILEKERVNFKAFGRAAGQRGFIDRISSMLSEFKRYNVNPDLLDDTKELVGDRFLKDKLEDLSLIYKRYEEMVHARYMDTDDDLTILAKRMDRSKKLINAEIWIDEFSGFTPQEYEIIKKLLKLCSRVNVCLCTDCLIDEEKIQDMDVFSPTKYASSRLLEIAQEMKVQIDKPVKMEGEVPVRFSKNRAMAHLEKNFFSYPYTVYKDETKSIGIMAAANPYSEVEAVANEIIYLCRDKGLRYKDMAVVTKDLDSYEKLVRVIFTQFDIPFFIDKKRAVADHPLAMLVISAIGVIQKNFTYESIFRYLKTGLAGVDREDVDLLENYVLANGIRGSQWYNQQQWEYRLNHSFGDEEPTMKEREIIDRVNAVRQNIIEPLIRLKEELKKAKSARQMCLCLYEFLCQIGIPGRIEELIVKYTQRGELEIAEEYKQIWDVITQVMDQVVEISGNEEMSLDDFYNLLNIGFAQYDMGIIPHSSDQLLVGSVDRWRSHEIHSLFILGVNDGVFPAAARDEGMLSDGDREILKSLGLELALDTKTKAFQEQYLLYTTLTKAGKYLRLSYPVADHEGKALRPSYVINRLKKIFPKMVVESKVLGEEDAINLIGPPLPSFNYLVGILRNLVKDDKDTELWKEVYLWFMNNHQWKDKLMNVAQGLSYSNEEKPLGKEKVGKLYGNVHYSSVSRLERFASCPFSYYVQYGLKAKERKVMKLEAPDIGSFLHLVVSRFSEELESQGIKWKDVDEAWCQEQISKIVDEIIESSHQLPFKRSKRYGYLKDRLKKVVTRSIWIIAEQVKRSGFQPIAYEVAFGQEDGLPAITLDIPGGQQVILTGRIDRIDILETDKGTYVRIIDYKSGSKDFKLSDIYNGIELQLITYLSAIWEKGLKSKKGTIMPAGILYFKLDDPILRIDGNTSDEDVYKKLMKEMKMKGLILADKDVIMQMDKTIEGDSLIIPASIRKDGSLGSRSSAATMEQFEKLKSHVRQTLIKLSSEMFSGNISISPYKRKKFISCQYCPYSAICRFEGETNKFRVVGDMKDEDVWRLLERGESDKGGENVG
ncbi:helicase-exonuclease AddAB subunit AddB [Lutispora thermophila]|uniref:ATP-dependent helicase/deoxyribonuclease subunit B n=1 Tax=Lutispora thermophila DSM 19022 TaxID=1122184 RepID=A0A1M6E5Y7_9FIRM|nr:helicase-exonuclease AddAB subunit AddB [Lutispora thermophila]SHI80926.1 DNA helicase/exodeoxyribonuclease V, subunit B [Lutispora thermophila DSM 19022]